MSILFYHAFSSFLHFLQVLIFDKHKGNHTNRTININQKEIKTVAKVKLLGIEIDDKLNFNHHINNICKSASNQLNTLKYLLGLKERQVLVNTFVMSNFNYCCPLCNFSSAQSLNKIYKKTYSKELYTSCWTIMTALMKIC